MLYIVCLLDSLPYGRATLFKFQIFTAIFRVSEYLRTEPHRNKTNKMACAPSKDSDQPGHPRSLIRGFAVRLMGS